MIIKNTTLMVLLSAVTLGAVVYYFDWRHGGTEKSPVEVSQPAFSIQASDVVALTITHPATPDEPAIRIEKQDGGWQIVEPISTPADESSVQGIVDNLADARISQTEPGTPDRLKAYGLDPPGLSIEFQLQNGAKHSVLLGNPDITGSSAYSLVDNAKSVALLPDSLRSNAGKSLTDLRNKRALRFDTADITHVEIHDAHGTIAATRGQNDQWTLDSPAAQKGKTAQGWKIFDPLTGLRAQDVLDHPPAKVTALLAHPAIQVTLTEKSGKILTLGMSTESGGDVYARASDSPVVYKLAKRDFDSLNLEASQLLP